MSQVPAAISKCGGKVGALCSDLSPYLPSRAPSGPRELCIRRHEQESKTLASGATIEDRPSVSHSHLCRSRAIPGEDTRVGSVSRWHRQADVDTEAAMSYSIPCTMYMYLSLHLRAFFLLVRMRRYRLVCRICEPLLMLDVSCCSILLFLPHPYSLLTPARSSTTQRRPPLNRTPHRISACSRMVAVDLGKVL